MTVTIERAGTDEATFVDVFSLLVEEHGEVACARLNVEKASRHAYTVLSLGMTLVARNESGEAVGVLGLKEVTFWYSDETALFDAFFYVKPAYRRQHVGVALMQAAQAVAADKDMLLFIMTANANRRPKKTAMTLMAQMAGFMPAGYLLKLR